MDIIIIEHVANFVIPPLSHWNCPMFVPNIVAMPIVVVALFELIDCVLEIVTGGCEVQRRVRVGPELCPLPSPPHCLENFVTINIPDYRHLFHR